MEQIDRLYKESSDLSDQENLSNEMTIRKEYEPGDAGQIWCLFKDL